MNLRKMATKASYDYLIKLIIIGDSGVGKTCILMRFADDSFTTTHISTIGIDFKIKPTSIDGKTVKLQIWDTAGQERFRTITQTYYKGAMGIILAYDCTDDKSFANVRNWMKQIESHATPGVCKVLIANKCDRPDKKVTAEQGRALANEYKMGFFETSAKTGENVKETFHFLAREVKSKIAPNANTSGGLRVTAASPEKKDPSQKAGCC